MTKLKKLFVLLPLLLMAAVNDAWADAKVTVHETITYSRQDWSDGWHESNFYKSVQKDDEIIVTKTGGSGSFMLCIGSTQNDIIENKQPFSDNSFTHTLTEAEAATISQNGKVWLVGAKASGSNGDFTVKIEVNYKGRENDNSLTWSGQHLAGWSTTDANNYINFPATNFSSLNADDSFKELVVYYIGTGNIDGCAFWIAGGGKEWSNSTWASIGSIRTADSNGKGAKVAYMLIPKDVVNDIKTNGIKLVGSKNDGDVIIVGGKVGTSEWSYNNRDWTAVSSLSLNNNGVTTNNGSGTAQIGYSLSPDAVSNNKIHWESDNTSIATVSSDTYSNSGNVTVTFVGEGDVTITATPWDNRGAVQTITYSRYVAPSVKKSRVFWTREKAGPTQGGAFNENAALTKTAVLGVSGSAGNSEVGIYKELFSDVQTGDKLTITIKSETTPGSHGILLKTIDGHTLTSGHGNFYRPGVLLGTPEVYTLSADDVKHLKGYTDNNNSANNIAASDLRVIGYSGNCGNEGNYADGTFEVEVTLSRNGVDLFQIPSSGNKTPTGLWNEDGVLRFDQSLFTQKFIKKNGSNESWNPGMWFKCEPQNGYGTATDDFGFGGIAVRMVSWNDTEKKFNVKHFEFSNNLYVYPNGSLRFKGAGNNTKEFWFQFTDEMITALNGGWKFMDVVGQGTLKITDADFDFTDQNESRGWTIADHIDVWNYNSSTKTTTGGTSYTANKSDNTYTLSFIVRGTESNSECNLQNVHWETSDASIASFDGSSDKDATGSVTLNLHEVGQVVLTATAWDNRPKARNAEETKAVATITLSVIETSSGYELRFVPDGKQGEANNRVYAWKKVDGKNYNGKPLIISLHGAGNDYNNWGRVNFDRWAESGDAVVIYPRGTMHLLAGLNANDPVRSWDAYNETSTERTPGVNFDVEFFKNILKDVKKSTADGGLGINYDASKVYIVGFSNGGMMAYQAAADMSELVAAFSAVAGYPVNEFHIHNQGARPMPFLHIHGMVDNTVNPITYDFDSFINTMKYRNGTNWNQDGSSRTRISTKLRDGDNDENTTYDHIIYTPYTSNILAKNAQTNEAGTEGVGFEVMKVNRMGHTPWVGQSGDYFDVAAKMWKFLTDKTLPSVTKVQDSDGNNTQVDMYNNGYSTVKFRADLSNGSHTWFNAPGNKYYYDQSYYTSNSYTSSKELLRYGVINKPTLKVTDDNVAESPEARNVYRTLQLETRDNNHDGVVQGYHRMRLRIMGNSANSYIVVRLRDIETNNIVLYKRFKADTREKTVDGGVTTYGDAKWTEIRANFIVPMGWQEYELLIDKGNATDETSLNFVEFASGSFTEVTPEEAYNPENLPSLHEMNLIFQPKFGNINGGVAKSYIPIAQINPKHGREANSSTEKPDSKDYKIDSNWTTSTTETTVAVNDDKIKVGGYITHRDAANSTGEKEAYVTDDANNAKVVAFLGATHTERKTLDGGGEDVEVTVDNKYTLRPLPASDTDKAYGLNLAQYGKSGMAAYANNPNLSGNPFPSKATFVMKASGTVDITMLIDNVAPATTTGDKAYDDQQGYDICVYYMNGEQTKPKRMARYTVKGHGGEDAWDDTYNHTAITASVRMQHLGSDGTCTVFFCYEGTDSGSDYETGETIGHPIYNDDSNSNLWVKGFVVKRPDLKVTIGRTDRTYVPNAGGNTNGTPYGVNKPYRWLFKGAGFDRREVYNVRDYRTYLCGYVDGDESNTLVWDHLLVYSENNTSRAHFVGYSTDEHLQFDSPTQFRYDTYENGVNPGIQDINADIHGEAFDPIVNDGLKVNVTGSGWFKVRARVPYKLAPNDQHAVKMTIMTSPNGGTEHIKLLRYFKMPADGKYHDYVAYLKASSLFGKNNPPEEEQQSLFVVFEDIGADINTTEPTSTSSGDAVNGEVWDGDNNGFQVDLQYLEWLNDEVPDYVFQREQYLFYSQTDNDEVVGHENHAYLRKRQKVEKEGETLLYWQAGGANADAYRIKNGIVYADENCSQPLLTDNALEKGGFAYDTNWQMVSGGTYPKYPDGANTQVKDHYTEFGIRPHRGQLSSGENQYFGGYWDMAAMPALGLETYINATPTNPNTDWVYQSSYYEGHLSPLWNGAHTEMQSPRIYNQSYNESKRGSSSEINDFTWTADQEFVPRDANTEFDLPISGPFFRFMPMKNAKITAYVVSGNTDGKIYVLDERGQKIKNEANTDWSEQQRYGFFNVENGTVTTDGEITPATDKCDKNVEHPKTVKITINARSGKEYFLCSKGMAIGVAAMYFEKDAVDKRYGTFTVSENGGITTAPDATNKLINEASFSSVNNDILLAANDDGHKYVDVTIDRKFERNKWYSIVLPFSMNEEKFKEVFGSDAQCLHFEKVDGDSKKIYLLHHRYNMIVANRPIFVRTGTDMDLVDETDDGKGTPKLVTDVTLQPERPKAYKSASSTTTDNLSGYTSGYYAFVCSYKPVNMKSGSIVMSTNVVGGGSYVGQLALMKSTQATKGMRSWIQPIGEGVFNSKLNYASFNYDGTLLDDELTGIEEIFMDDSGFNIVNTSDKVYDLNGRFVATGADMNALPAGIYIINGKKFVK